MPRMTVDGYNETRGSALQRLTSVLTNARSQVASEVRKRMYSRRLDSARYPQIPAALPGAAGSRRQGPVSSDRTPVALRVAQDLRRNTAAPRPSLRGKTVRSASGCGLCCADSSLRMFFTLRSSVYKARRLMSLCASV